MVDGNAGKGSKYRPVDQKKWDEGWEKAFKKRNQKTSVMKKGGIIDKSGVPNKKDNENE